MSFEPDTSGTLTATVTGTGISGSSTTVRMISTVDPAVTISYDLNEYTFKEDALATDVNIYLVATVDPAYPRAPEDGLYLAIFPGSGTAIFREDYVGLVGRRSSIEMISSSTPTPTRSWPASACEVVSIPTSKSSTMKSTKVPNSSS